MKRLVILMTILTATGACEFDESGLERPYEGKPIPDPKELQTPDGGVATATEEEVEMQTQALGCWFGFGDCIDDTGLPNPVGVTPPPGGWNCTGEHPMAPVGPRAVRLYQHVGASTWGACLQFPIGYFRSLGDWGLNDRVSSVRLGDCADVVLYQHTDRWGAANYILEPPFRTTDLTGGWNDLASSIDVRQRGGIRNGRDCDHL